MSESVRPTAAAVILMDTLGQVLMFARWGNPNDLGLPAGMIDEGETAREAAIRELFEETGLTAIGEPELYMVRQSGEHLCAAYIINDWSGELKAKDEEGHPLWGDPMELLGAECEFADFNRAWMTQMGIIAA